MLYRCEVLCEYPEPHPWVGYVEAKSPVDAIEIVHHTVPGRVTVDTIRPLQYTQVKLEWGDKPFLGSNRSVWQWLDEMYSPLT